MFQTITRLVTKLDYSLLSKTSVIEWGSPIPVFGSLKKSQVATIGLNPSNREFLDKSGKELKGRKIRFHTLNSLGIMNWQQANSNHIRLIIDMYENYFYNNPYDVWFKKFNRIVEATGTSFYSDDRSACHLDIIPFSTKEKWVNLPQQERNYLLALTGNTLADLLKKTQIRLLILNGMSVVRQFEDIAEVIFQKTLMPSWMLQRKQGNGVKGYAFYGEIESLFNIGLDRKIIVLGFNHNIQSSFGITNDVINSISDWISHKTDGMLN